MHLIKKKKNSKGDIEKQKWYETLETKSKTADRPIYITILKAYNSHYIKSHSIKTSK